MPKMEMLDIHLTNLDLSEKFSDLHTGLWSTVLLVCYSSFNNQWETSQFQNPARGFTYSWGNLKCSLGCSQYLEPRVFGQRQWSFASFMLLNQGWSQFRLTKWVALPAKCGGKWWAGSTLLYGKVLGEFSPRVDQSFFPVFTQILWTRWCVLPVKLSGAGERKKRSRISSIHFIITPISHTLPENTIRPFPSYPIHPNYCPDIATWVELSQHHNTSWGTCIYAVHNNTLSQGSQTFTPPSIHPHIC